MLENLISDSNTNDASTTNYKRFEKLLLNDKESPWKPLPDSPEKLRSKQNILKSNNGDLIRVNDQSSTYMKNYLDLLNATADHKRNQLKISPRKEEMKQISEMDTESSPEKKIVVNSKISNNKRKHITEATNRKRVKESVIKIIDYENKRKMNINWNSTANPSNTKFIKEGIVYERIFDKNLYTHVYHNKMNRDWVPVSSLTQSKNF